MLGWQGADTYDQSCDSLIPWRLARSLRIGIWPQLLRWGRRYSTRQYSVGTVSRHTGSVGDVLRLDTTFVSGWGAAWIVKLWQLKDVTFFRTFVRIRLEHAVEGGRVFHACSWQFRDMTVIQLLKIWGRRSFQLRRRSQVHKIIYIKGLRHYVLLPVLFSSLDPSNFLSLLFLSQIIFKIRLRNLGNETKKC